MSNLNELMKWKTEDIFGLSSASIELNLGEGDFPELDEDTERDYNLAFGQLYDEVAKVQPTKVRVTSELEGKIQRVLIEHNGSPIKDAILEELNSKLVECEKGDTHYLRYMRHGNLIAASILQKYGGRVQLSNISDEEYHVQTKVEIPVNPNYTPPTQNHH